MSPEILFPGDTALLTLTIKNAETTSTTATTITAGGESTVNTDTVGATIQNVWIETIGSDDKEVKASSNYEDIGVLAPSSSITISFQLVAEENVSDGTYFPLVHVDLESTSYEDVSYPIAVKVSSAQVKMISKSVPSTLSRSGSTDVTLTIVNNRDSSVDALTITPQNSGRVEFKPESYFISSLDAHDSEEISFSITPTEVGPLNLSFNMSYYNGYNSHYIPLVLPITIVETLDVAPVFYSVPSTVTSGETSRIRLEVYNAKTTSISGVIVTPLSEIDMFPSQFFIGSMDPDDVFTASFDLQPNDLTMGNYSVGFKVSFKQGEEYYETPTLSTSIMIIPAIENSNDLGLGVYLGIGIVLVVVVVVFYFFKRRQTA
jgi:hypothetical protein